MFNWYIIYYYAFNEKNIQYNKLKWKQPKLILEKTNLHVNR
jgi:hypothetical protein